MTKEGTRIAPAALLLLSLGLNNALYAEGNNPQSLSYNCQKATETSSSAIRSMWMILCRQEYENQMDFANLHRLANSIAGQELSDSGTKERPKQPRNIERPPSTPPRRHAKAKSPDVHKWGGTGFAASDKAHSRGPGGRHARVRRPKPHVASDASIRDAYFIRIRLRDLNRSQRMELRSKYESLLTRGDVRDFLNWIQKHEGGGIVTVVGGIRHKSPSCQKLIGRLNTSAHPKDQGLPNKCFLTTRKYGLSTAAGKFQIVHKNWKVLRRLLELKDFSARSQALVALELVRSSKVIGGKVGDGLVALVQGDVAGAIRWGTDPWASSPHSRWYERSRNPSPQYARLRHGKPGHEKHARWQSASFRGNTNA
ncbi:MAG: hypothetical protein QOE46_500 [Acidobacteriota bacterium]|nr:hypothetical protein [Acidobacteriota bacterium]